MHKGILVVHLSTLSLGLLSFLAASFLALLYFWEQRQLKRKTLNNRRFFPLDQVDRYASRLTTIGFLFLSFAIVTGLYLAHFYWKHEAWWYNPKLILSCVVWVWYFAVLCMKRFVGLRGTRFLFSMVVGLLLLCFVFIATYAWSAP